MKAINNYIIEKLHLNKGIQVSKEESLKSLEREIRDILNKFDIDDNECRIYHSDDNGYITDERIHDTTQLGLYIAPYIQKGRWGKNNKKMHEKIAKALEDSGIPDIKSVIAKETTYSREKLKIEIKLRSI